MTITKGHRSRSAAAVIILWALFLAIVVAPRGASAGQSACRTDPVVILADGTVIQMEAEIGTSIDRLQKVVYTVHAPVGSTVLTIVYTDTLLGIDEKVVFYADNPPGRYTTDTVVYTRDRKTSVTATSRLVEPLGLELAGGSDSGLDRQHLIVKLTR